MQIALRTSQRQILDHIRTATANRNVMLNMKTVCREAQLSATKLAATACPPRRRAALPLEMLLLL